MACEYATPPLPSKRLEVTNFEMMELQDGISPDF